MSDADTTIENTPEQVRAWTLGYEAGRRAAAPVGDEVREAIDALSVLREDANGTIAATLTVEDVRVLLARISAPVAVDEATVARVRREARREMALELKAAISPPGLNWGLPEWVPEEIRALAAQDGEQ
ncbi:hypothetical protein [Enterococcus hirae]|uniref:hypothetical protein n=1 Tax=Enterococcus hirae TaxID=1354 RepID=UPI00136D3B81|nr:hypothetical protein [Enterococcus hirae]NAE18274.1 hypothetical protein [Enterococcus hirae]